MRLIAVFFVVIPWEDSGVRGELFVSGHRQQWHPSLCQHVPRPQDVIRKGSQMDLVFALISHDGLFYWLIPLDKHNTTHKQSTKCWDEFERTHKYSYSRSSTQPIKTHGLKQPHIWHRHRSSHWKPQWYCGCPQGMVPWINVEDNPGPPWPKTMRLGWVSQWGGITGDTPKSWPFFGPRDVPSSMVGFQC